MSKLPPYLASEISTEILKIEPSMRRVFALDEFEMNGESLEDLLQASWLCGYARAIEEISNGPGPFPPLPELAAWIKENMLDRH